MCRSFWGWQIIIDDLSKTFGKTPSWDDKEGCEVELGRKTAKSKFMINPVLIILDLDKNESRNEYIRLCYGRSVVNEVWGKK